MKRLIFIIPIYIFLFLFQKQVNALDCCPAGFRVGETECVRDFGGGQPYQCDQIEPYCNTGTNNCSMQPLPNCSGYSNCSDLTYRQQYNGCISPDGFQWYCSFVPQLTVTKIISLPPVKVTGDTSRFCNGTDKTGGINTAIGCIKVKSGEDLITTILRLATGVGGGIALLLILYGVFIVTTSAGMPDKLKAGGEIITSAIIGLVFVLLSLFLVQLIGINILGIPGLI